MGQRESIAKRFKRGDLARAYDLCVEALRSNPDDLWLRHRAVLCLIRSGALERAQADYERFRLAEARHDEDCLALGARLLKAVALESDAALFPDRAREAGDKYLEIFEQTGGHYPGINAATMYRLSGDTPRSLLLARKVLEACQSPLPHDPEEAYYQCASEAEAYLLLGELGAANLALRRAISQDRDNFIAHATTLRQLRLVSRSLNLPEAWLTGLEPPRPAHYAGHIFRAADEGGGLVRERTLRQAIAGTLEAQNIGSLYGALAAGSDILFAEAAMRARKPLTLVLPVPVPVFMEASVKPFGQSWVRRCEACLEHATDIVEVTTDRQLMSQLSLNHASSIAMGLSRIRAEVLGTRPVQVLISDGQDKPDTPYGTYRDARVWRETGAAQCLIPFQRAEASAPVSRLPMPEARAGFDPALRAMLFLDVRGSSTVPDDRIPDFVRHVLGCLAEVCEGLDPAPLYSDSWGDGFFLTFADVADAARAATILQQAFARIDLDQYNLPNTLGLRIAGHCGPVHEGQDPIQHRKAPFGAQVAIASRIEAVTVPGSIFVSETFAARLAMSAQPGLRCEYVGLTEIDAYLPDMPLYALRAVAPGSLEDRRNQMSARAEHPVQ
ncbi:tetratricopeptide repeat-containing protein [Maricaulis parjimensis]|uniref:tetratricopeptide repeat-containing protein n=1 Tax=Maricaulis parjimensis TaxID=144023 RepID=UPI00193A76C7|nr:tetratricopeptide repeat-containing protein [Maricaulis parjimensis]